MRKYLVSLILLLILFSNVHLVEAGTFYLHDHPDYWWYVVEEPAFSIVVPSGAANYAQRSREIIDLESLEITFPGGSIFMEVNHMPGKDVKAVRDTLAARYKPLVRNIAMISDKEITTSNNLKAFFYAYEGNNPSGKKIMFRSVIFQKGEHIVYLTMLLNAKDFQGDTREYWIRAVNGFEWN